MLRARRSTASEPGRQLTATEARFMSTVENVTEDSEIAQHRLGCSPDSSSKRNRVFDRLGQARRPKPRAVRWLSAISRIIVVGRPSLFKNLESKSQNGMSTSCNPSRNQSRA
jgi:hypothetical protein